MIAKFAAAQVDGIDEIVSLNVEMFCESGKSDLFANDSDFQHHDRSRKPAE